MRKRMIIFKAAGRTVQFAAKVGKKAGKYGVAKGRAWAAKQRSKAIYAPYRPAQTKATKNARGYISKTKKPRKQSGKGMVWARCPICYNLQLVKKGQQSAWIARHVKAVHGRD